MSNFFSWWISIITVVNIVACYWLIRWTMKKRPDEAETGSVTGHSWDGLEEYNNPLPRWWLWLFYITIVFGFAYLTLYPGLGKWQGVAGWSSGNTLYAGEGSQYAMEMAKADADYGPIFAKFAETPIPTLAKDEKAVQAGERLFGSYCSQCHGADAKGTTSYPNLSDNDWLYGGSPEAIKSSIMNGRQGVMPAFGAPLGEKGVEDVATYVQSLSGRPVDEASAARGKEKFMQMCVACHGPDAKGNQLLGAPNLTDTIWLHGSSAGAIKDTISKGRTNKMPAHNVFLGNDKSHLLAAYIYSLSN